MGIFPQGAVCSGAVSESGAREAFSLFCLFLNGAHFEAHNRQVPDVFPVHRFEELMTLDLLHVRSSDPVLSVGAIPAGRADAVALGPFNKNVGKKMKIYFLLRETAIWSDYSILNHNLKLAKLNKK